MEESFPEESHATGEDFDAASDGSGEYDEDDEPCQGCPECRPMVMVAAPVGVPGYLVCGGAAIPGVYFINPTGSFLRTGTFTPVQGEPCMFVEVAPGMFVNVGTPARFEPSAYSPVAPGVIYGACIYASMPMMAASQLAPEMYADMPGLIPEEHYDTGSSSGYTSYDPESYDSGSSAGYASPASMLNDDANADVRRLILRLERKYGPLCVFCRDLENVERGEDGECTRVLCASCCAKISAATSCKQCSGKVFVYATGQVALYCKDCNQGSDERGFACKACKAPDAPGRNMLCSGCAKLVKAAAPPGLGRRASRKQRNRANRASRAAAQAFAL